MTGRRLRSLFGSARHTYARFKHDGGVRLSAALAYYTLFAFAPLLILAIAGAKALIDTDLIAALLQDLASGAIGEEMATLFVSTLQASAGSWTETTIGVVGVGLLMWSAVVAFAQLHASFNEMWHVRVRLAIPAAQRIKIQLPRLALVLLPTAMLLAATLASSVMGWAAQQSPFVNVNALIAALGSPVAVVTAAWISLTVLYRFVPDAKVRIRSVVFPALVVSAAWALGTWLYGLYLSYAGTQSISGAAGAIFLLLVWMNYSARAMLLGCWWCRWRAERDGGLIPLPHAELLQMNHGDRSPDAADLPPAA